MYSLTLTKHVTFFNLIDFSASILFQSPPPWIWICFSPAVCRLVKSRLAQSYPDWLLKLFHPQRIDFNDLYKEDVTKCTKYCKKDSKDNCLQHLQSTSFHHTTLIMLIKISCNNLFFLSNVWDGC